MTAGATMTSLDRLADTASPPEFSSLPSTAAADTATLGSKTAVFAADDAAAACELLWRDATTGSGCQVRWGHWTAPADGGAAKLAYDRVTAAPASIPAGRHVAVEVYNADGRTRMLPVDLDAKNAGDDAAVAVTKAAFEVTRLVEACEGASVWDISETSEGAHVLILLPEEAGRDEVAPVVKALKCWVKSKVGADVVDTRPALGPKASCITLPGTIDKGRLPRQLMTLPHDAAKAVTERGRPGLLQRLREALADHMQDPVPAIAPPAPRLPARPVPVRPRTETVLMAWARGRLGVPAKYPSSSEARLAALKALAGAGRDAESVWDEIRGGDLAGIAESFEHNRELADARAQFDVEWAKAVNHLGPGAVAGPPSTRMTLRMIARALELEAAQAATPAARQHIRVMRGALYAAAVSGSTVINHGCRSYTFSAGLPSHGVVATVMNAEDAAGDEGFATALNRSFGPSSGIVWRMQLPARYAYLAEPAYRAEVRAAAIEPVHGAFAKLGMAAMWLLDALADGGHAAVVDLAAAARVSATRAAAVLGEMAEHGLVARGRDGRWRRTSKRLDDAAAALGVPEAFEARRRQYADQRAKWRSFWDKVVATAVSAEQEDELPPPEAWYAPAWTDPTSPPAGADPPA